MSKRLVISSNYLYPEDLGVIEQAAACRIDAFPKLSELTTTQIEAFEQCAKGADLVIIALFGTSATLLDRLPLKRITAPKALWSFDSHHDWALERQWQDRFDKLFIRPSRPSRTSRTSRTSRSSRPSRSRRLRPSRTKPVRMRRRWRQRWRRLTPGCAHWSRCSSATSWLAGARTPRLTVPR